MKFSTILLKMLLKLEVFWICLWITLAEVSSDYILSNDKFSWQDVKNKSNFATPRFQVHNSSLIVNIASNLHGNEEAWVGYYKRQTAFAYIGCWRINSAEPSFLLPMSNNTPGLCFSMCNKLHQNYIGLNKYKCFCMSKKPDGNIVFPECNISLDGTWRAGGTDEYISIYERMKTDVDARNSPVSGSCLTFEYSENINKLVWDDCRKAYLALCHNGDNVFIARYNTQSYFGWRYYVQICFKNNSFPMTYNYIINSSVTLATGPSWSNVVCSDVIYTYRESSFSTSSNDVIKYGYITKTGNMTVLSFTNNKNDKRQVLLKADNSTTSSTTKPSSSYPILSSNVSVSKNSTEGVKSTTITPSRETLVSQVTLTSEIDYTVKNRTEGFKSTINTSTSESSDVGVVIGVSVVIVVVLIAVVVTVIFLKRRGKIPSLCINNSTVDKSSEGTSGKPPAENNVYVQSPQETAYAQIDELRVKNNVEASQDLELSNSHHTYFILEPGSRESTTDNDISDTMKDSTNNNDDYNTLHETVNFGTNVNDTYDTTETAAMKLKALKDTGDEHVSPKAFGEIEEDAYNHINKHPLKTGKTDNIYGIPNGIENDYGDIRKGKDPFDEDDTYNHLKPKK